MTQAFGPALRGGGARCFRGRRVMSGTGTGTGTGTFVGGSECAGRETCKPSFVPALRRLRAGDGHSSGRRIAAPLERYTRWVSDGPSVAPVARAASASPAFDLAPGGVYRPPMSPWGARELLPHAFTLTSEAEAGRRSTLCGTFPEVALAGRYPAPSPCGARTFLPLRGPDRSGPAGERPSVHSPCTPTALATPSDRVNRAAARCSHSPERCSRAHVVMDGQRRVV